MEAVFSFGTSVPAYKTTRRHIMEYGMKQESDWEDWEKHEDVRENGGRT
jgi:hypothetical protein